MIKILEVNGKEYQLKLTAGNLVELERKLGCSAIDVFMKFSQGHMPTTEELLSIVHSSMKKYNHSIKFEQVCNIYDDWVEEGNSFEDLMTLVVEILEECGAIPKGGVSGEQSPNL